MGRAPASGSHSDNEEANKYRRYEILMSTMKKTKWVEVTERPAVGVTESHFGMVRSGRSLGGGEI